MIFFCHACMPIGLDGIHIYNIYTCSYYIIIIIIIISMVNKCACMLPQVDGYR